MTTELFWLTLVAAFTAVMWLPYVLDRMLVLGIPKTLGNPSDDNPALHDWAQRAKAAHSNAIENLVVFGVLILAVQASGQHSELTALAAMLYFWSRVAHFVVYTAGIPLLRTLSFFGGFVAQLMLAIALLS